MLNLFHPAHILYLNHSLFHNFATKNFLHNQDRKKYQLIKNFVKYSMETRNLYDETNEKFYETSLSPKEPEHEPILSK